MLELLGYVVMGWILYTLISAWVTVRQIKSAVGDIVEKKMLEEAVDRQILVVRTEPVEQGEHRVVLAYNNHTNKFLGQDATQDAVEAMIKEKYANMHLIFVNEKATIQSVHSVDTKSI